MGERSEASLTEGSARAAKSRPRPTLIAGAAAAELSPLAAVVWTYGGRNGGTHVGWAVRVSEGFGPRSSED